MDLRIELTKAAEESGTARKKRDSLIRKAHKSGMSLRQIAGATDLSFQRVHQIIRQRRTDPFVRPAKSIKASAKRRTDRSTRLRRVRERARIEADQQQRDR